MIYARQTVMSSKYASISNVRIDTINESNREADRLISRC